jgi:hypothetical protein
MSAYLGTNYLPERTYYDLHSRMSAVDVTKVKHVSERLKGWYIAGFEMQRPDLSGLFERELRANPNYYASNIQIDTNMHRTTVFAVFLGMLTLPAVTVEFDVLEVTPSLESQPPHEEGAQSTHVPSD